jgi:hypothetical protein
LLRHLAARLIVAVRRLDKIMLDVLAKIYDDGGAFLGVEYSLFEGDEKFITAVGLRFETLSAVFRAVPDDDTLAVTIEHLKPDAEETLIDATNSAPWSACVGYGICWAWRLTNQQGYSDGVRLEFSKPGETSRAVVELLVMASAVQISCVVPCATTEQAVPADCRDERRSG